MTPSKFAGEVRLKYAEKSQINGNPPSDLQNCFLSVCNAELLHRLSNMAKHNLSTLFFLNHFINIAFLSVITKKQNTHLNVIYVIRAGMSAIMEAMIRQFSNEELVNCITHGIGLILSIAGLLILVDLAWVFGGSLQIVSCSIFGSTLVLLYGSSTIYHYFKTSRFDRVFKTIDHSSIYILISGTYTPFALVNLRGSWGWTLFGIVWGLCLIGIVFKIFFVYRFKIISTLIYIFMGWIGIIAGEQLFTHIRAGGLLLLLIGGLSYTGGTVFYAWKRLPYHHAIWHLFVIAGSTCHYFAVMFYVLPL